MPCHHCGHWVEIESTYRNGGCWQHQSGWWVFFHWGKLYCEDAANLLKPKDGMQSDWNMRRDDSGLEIARGEMGFIEVVVVGVYGESLLELSIDSEFKVGALRQEIGRITLVPAEEQHLMCCGNILDIDDASMSDLRAGARTPLVVCLTVPGWTYDRVGAKVTGLSELLDDGAEGPRFNPQVPSETASSCVMVDARNNDYCVLCGHEFERSEGRRGFSFPVSLEEYVNYHQELRLVEENRATKVVAVCVGGGVLVELENDAGITIRELVNAVYKHVPEGFSVVVYPFSEEIAEPLCIATVKRHPDGYDIPDGFGIEIKGNELVKIQADSYDASATVFIAIVTVYDSSLMVQVKDTRKAIWQGLAPVYVDGFKCHACSELIKLLIGRLSATG